MNNSLYLLLITGIAASIAIPSSAYAVSEYTNFFAGAESQESDATEKGLRTIIEIESASGNHNFDWSDEENHNYFVEIKDGSNYRHHVGYFVDDDAPTTAKFFAEAFLGSTQKTYYESMGAVSSDGTNQLFAVHYGGSSWSYYDGTGFGDLEHQYNGGGSSFNANTAIAMFEKGCKGGCTVDQMGDIVDVQFHTAMEHTPGTVYTTASWDLIDEADMFYEARNATNVISGSLAEPEVCGEMTLEGNEQDGSLSDNEIMAINESSPTCTSTGTTLWEP